MKIRIIHGPNLNLLGTRELSIYGTAKLADINAQIQELADKEGVDVDFFQSNHEGALIDHIQSSCDCDGLVINPAAYTHTSIAIRDALLAVGVPFVEVHLSDIQKREQFRQHSFLSDIALQVFSGQGPASYEKGFLALIEFLRRKEA